MAKGDYDTGNENPLRSKSPPQRPQDTPTGWNLLKTFRALRLPEDSEGNAWAIPVIVVDPGPESMIPATVRNYARSAAENVPGMMVYAVQELYNNLSQPTILLEMQRTPTIFKSLQSQNAPATVWDPAAGRTVRILGGNIALSKEAACAAAFSMMLQDGGATFWGVTISNAALVATGNVVNIPISFGQNGYLSVAADNLITVNFSAALTAGAFSINLWGTEE